MDQSFMLIFDLISLGCGGYMLLTWIKLRIAGVLFPNGLLIPKDKAIKDCTDAQGYIRYISPRLLIISIIIVAFGVINLINEFVPLFNWIVGEILIAITLVILGWYAVCTKKAYNLYW